MNKLKEWLVFTLVLIEVTLIAAVLLMVISYFLGQACFNPAT